MGKRLILVAAAVLAVAPLAEAAAKSPPTSDPRWCWGTFTRHSCMNGTSGKDCAYPRKPGDRDEFMGWDDQDGVRSYVIYRLGAYPAANIAIDDGCHLREW
jgi:hypothetical protein